MSIRRAPKSLCAGKYRIDRVLGEPTLASVNRYVNRKRSGGEAHFPTLFPRFSSAEEPSPLGGTVPRGSTTEEYAHGSPFWTKVAVDKWQSPVSPGHNEITWDEVRKPAGVGYDDFTPTQLIGIQFHAVTNDKARKFRFCVNNFSFLL